MNGFIGFEKGMGIGGWLTNYKRFNVLPPERRMLLTVGDFEHFDTYITESDVKYIASLGMDLSVSALTRLSLRKARMYTVNTSSDLLKIS